MEAVRTVKPKAPSIGGFIREEGVEVAIRALSIVGGSGQAILGISLCSTVAGCVLGGPLIVLGASNVQKGITGRDGFGRNTIKAVLGNKQGDIAFGVINVGASIGGLVRPVLKQGARPLFKAIPDDFEPAIQGITDVGLSIEILTNTATVVDTLNK